MFVIQMQEAFFGKTLIDLSKKAVMIPPGQRTGACLVRPSLSAPSGVKTTSPESKNTNLKCDSWKLCEWFVILGVEKGSTFCVTFVLVSLAEAKDCVVEEHFPVKQEGGDAHQAQGEGAGKHLFGHCIWFIVMAFR